MNPYTAEAAYAPESETSKESAEQLVEQLVESGRAQSMNDKIVAAIEAAGLDGLTIDEAAVILNTVPGTASGRFRDLEKKGLIRKNEKGFTRTTRFGRQAVIYVKGDGIPQIEQAKTVQEDQPLRLSPAEIASQIDTFSWRNTPQGWSFWDQVYSALKELPEDITRIKPRG